MFTLIKEELIARNAQRYMYLLFYMAAVSLFWSGVAAVEQGLWWLLPIGLVVVSPIMMALLRRIFEGPLDQSFFDPKLMSWSFVLGDVIVLPYVLWFAGRGWQDIRLTDGENGMMLLASIVVAILAIVGFRYLDGARYRSVGWESALKSPTKVWHDFVVMSVVTALLFWLLVPQVVLQLTDGERAGGAGNMVAALVFLAFFIVLIAVDGLNPPNPKHQHYRWDPKRFKPIRY